MTTTPLTCNTSTFIQEEPLFHLEEEWKYPNIEILIYEGDYYSAPSREPETILCHPDQVNDFSDYY